MRVKGPEGGPPPVDETAEAGAAAPAEATGAVGQAGRAVGAGRAAAARGVSTTGDLVDEIARRLRAGELTPQEAVEQLIDDAVDRQLGRVTAGRARLAGELKDILRRFTESDPYLASKIKRLGNR